MSAPPTRSAPLRSDAARNRSAIIGAGRAAFGQRGLDAPLDEIARQAGVGNATLYRHFPTRCDLVAAVFAETLEEVVQAARRALANPDPWDGFADHVMFLCQLQARDRGLADLLTTTMTGAPELEQLRACAHDDFVRIADRAKAAGALRVDFEAEDLDLLLMANAGLVHRTAAAAPSAWERLVRYSLDGLRRTSATTAAPPSAGEDAVASAMADQAALFALAAHDSAPRNI